MERILWSMSGETVKTNIAWWNTTHRTTFLRHQQNQPQNQGGRQRIRHWIHRSPTTVCDRPVKSHHFFRMMNRTITTDTWMTSTAQRSNSEPLGKCENIEWHMTWKIILKNMFEEILLENNKSKLSETKGATENSKLSETPRSQWQIIPTKTPTQTTHHARVTYAPYDTIDFHENIKNNT